jgi:hypothetical protein
MNKIQRVSHWFRLFFQLCFWLAPVLLALSWITVTAQVFQTTHPSLLLSPVPFNLLSTPVLHPLSAQTKWLGFLIGCIPTVINMLIFYFLIKLFKCYERAEIFSLQNVKYIRNVGWWMLISQIIRPIYEGVITAVLTFANPHGHRYASVSFGSTDIVPIITALIIILISWIMAEAYKLQDEQKLTI